MNEYWVSGWVFDEEKNGMPFDMIVEIQKSKCQTLENLIKSIKKEVKEFGCFPPLQCIDTVTINNYESEVK